MSWDWSRFWSCCLTCGICLICCCCGLIGTLISCWISRILISCCLISGCLICLILIWTWSLILLVRLISCSLIRSCLISYSLICGCLISWLWLFMDYYWANLWLWLYGCVSLISWLINWIIRLARHTWSIIIRGSIPIISTIGICVAHLCIGELFWSCSKNTLIWLVSARRKQLWIQILYQHTGF